MTRQRAKQSNFNKPNEKTRINSNKTKTSKVQMQTARKAESEHEAKAERGSQRGTATVVDCIKHLTERC